MTFRVDTAPLLVAPVRATLSNVETANVEIVAASLMKPVTGVTPLPASRGCAMPSSAENANVVTAAVLRMKSLTLLAMDIRISGLIEDRVANENVVSWLILFVGLALGGCAGEVKAVWALKLHPYYLFTV